jgi:hypothetical protein
MNLSKYLLPIFTLSMILFIGCDESDDIQRYEQEVLTTSGNPLTYTNLTSYPIIGAITSSAPTGDFDSPNRYRLLNVASTTGSSFVKASFDIDVDSGALIYNNFRQINKNTIGPPERSIASGVYVVDVGITNTNGMAIHEGAYQLTILDVPIQVDIDAVQVDAGIFEQGVMATVSYTDTSATQDITSVSYALVNAPAGFEINATTGAISKVNGAVSGANPLTVSVTTNVGIVNVENIVVVNVGPPPTLQMVQQDDTTTLMKAIVSPFTAYTTAAPVVDGMSPTQWEIVFPKTLVNDSPDVTAGEVAIDFSNAFSIENPSGKVSISADAGLPLGMHTISLKATNASANDFTFENALSIEVEERWETTPVYENDFSAQGSQITFHTMTGTTNIMSVRNHPKAENNPVLRFGIFGGANTDGATELKIPVAGTSLKKLRISFYEAFGYQSWWANRYIRTLSYNESLDDTSSLDDSTWTSIDASWSGSSLWDNINADVNTYNKISETIEVSSSTKNVSFFIRLKRDLTLAHAGGQWLLRNLKVEGSTAFTAEEY